jgi:hypothetical protein
LVKSMIMKQIILFQSLDARRVKFGIETKHESQVDNIGICYTKHKQVEMT